MDERDGWEAHAPWVIRDCACSTGRPACPKCDGAGWFFENTKTGATQSPMMADAFARHG